jgi:pyruvate dehydrogenase (quinone)
MAKGCHLWLVSSAHQMPRSLEIAIREAVGKRGVSVIVMPGDVALQAASSTPTPTVDALLPSAPVIVPAKRDLDRRAALLGGEGRVKLKPLGTWRQTPVIRI